MRSYLGGHLPYEKKVFNCRLSLAHRLVENVFGNILRRPLMLSPGHAESIVKRVVVLHNFLCREVGAHYMDPVPENCSELWSSQQHANTFQFTIFGTKWKAFSKNACAVRDGLKECFCSDVGMSEPFLDKMSNLHWRGKTQHAVVYTWLAFICDSGL